MAGDMGEDRKNVGLLVKAFLETFKNKMNKPALILKTSQVSSSYHDREEILKKIKQIFFNFVYLMIKVYQVLCKYLNQHLQIILQPVLLIQLFFQ